MEQIFFVTLIVCNRRKDENALHNSVTSSFYIAITVSNVSQIGKQEIFKSGKLCIVVVNVKNIQIWCYFGIFSRSSKKRKHSLSLGLRLPKWPQCIQSSNSSSMFTERTVCLNYLPMMACAPKLTHWLLDFRLEWRLVATIPKSLAGRTK